MGLMRYPQPGAAIFGRNRGGVAGSMRIYTSAEGKKSVTTLTVYCSGPLFCPEEIAGMTAIARVLADGGFDTFLPHRDGLEFYVMRHVNSPTASLPTPKKTVSRMIFALDVYQIVERCDALVLNMNGRVPDEGAVAEAAIAYAAGKPVLIYKNDVRTIFNGSDNAMVTCLTAAPIVREIAKIPGELEKLIQKTAAGESPYRGENIPPAMRDTINLGRKVWTVMNTIRLTGGTPRKDADLILQIAEACLTPPLP